MGCHLRARRELERARSAVGGSLDSSGEDQLTRYLEEAIATLRGKRDRREVDVGVEVSRGLNRPRVAREGDRRVATAQRWSRRRECTATVSTSADDEQRRPSTQEATHPHSGPPFRGDEH